MTKYLIDDINGDKKVLKVIEKTFNLMIFDAKEMTKKLIEWKGWSKFNPENTIIVLPGNGASIVKKYINNLDKLWLGYWKNKFYPYAKRVWKPGEDPRIFIERVDPNRILLGIKDVIVIDDVISSGLTIKRLRQINLPWIPNANWNAVTWMIQKAATTKSFLEVFAVEEVGTKERKVPINSISTLLEYSEIAESYAKRNFGAKSKSFLEILNSLK